MIYLFLATLVVVVTIVVYLNFVKNVIIKYNLSLNTGYIYAMFICIIGFGFAALIACIGDIKERAKLEGYNRGINTKFKVEIKLDTVYKPLSSGENIRRER